MYLRMNECMYVCMHIMFTLSYSCVYIALPWVLNGFIEARVSAIRLASALVNPGTITSSISPSYPSSTTSLQWKQPDNAYSASVNSNVTNNAHTDSKASSSSSYTDLLTTTTLLPKQATSFSSSVTVPDTPSYSTSEGLMWTYPIVNKSENPHQPFILRPISLSIPTSTNNSGGLYVITGPVGSGKSSLLLALLGELKPISAPLTNHQIRTTVDSSTTHFPIHTIHTTAATVDTSNKFSYSYCPQVPCLHSGSVRENILMGRPYDESRLADIYVPLYSVYSTMIASNLI